jgi:hypothetical protein
VSFHFFRFARVDDASISSRDSRSSTVFQVLLVLVITIRVRNNKALLVISIIFTRLRALCGYSLDVTFCLLSARWSSIYRENDSG